MSEVSQFDAVFWDIGGVILSMESITASHRRFVDSLVASHQTDLSSDEALSEWRTVLGEYFAEREGTTFRPAREGYRRAVDAVLDADADNVDWKSEFDRIVAEESSPNPGAVETIEVLAATSVHLGVLSDVDDVEGRRILDSFGVLDSFDSITTSEEVGRTKPAPAMFETALEKAGVTPERSVMIGDRYSHDMAGGRRAGMTTVAYGAEDGPAVDHRVESLTEILALVGTDS